MNERRSRDSKAPVSDAKNSMPSTAQPVEQTRSKSTSSKAPENPEPITDRALVVYERPEKEDGWFGRLLVALGLRSGSTLRDDLHQALSGEGSAGDAFSPEERAMLQNILRLREQRVEDVMVPRAEIEAVATTDSLADVLRIFEDTGHSRLPVYEDTLDDPRGMVLIKDLLLYMTKVASGKRKPRKGSQRTLDLSNVDLTVELGKLDVMRRLLFVPPSMLASDLMARMRATRTQMALVIDEYGGTDGLVSLEDIVEEVVGEIEDEHDEDESTSQIKALGDGIWNVDARVELEKLIEEIGRNFDPGDHAEDMDTLGGLVFALAGHVPVRGEVISGLPGFEFRVLDADPRRIRRVQIVQINLREKRRKAAAAKSAEQAAAQQMADEAKDKAGRTAAKALEPVEKPADEQSPAKQTPAIKTDEPVGRKTAKTVNGATHKPVQKSAE